MGKKDKGWKPEAKQDAQGNNSTKNSNRDSKQYS